MAGYCEFLLDLHYPELELTCCCVDKAVGGVGYVEDHQSPAEFLFKDDTGIGAYGSKTGKLAL